MENISTIQEAVNDNKMEELKVVEVSMTEGEMDRIVLDRFKREIPVNDPFWISNEARNLVPSLLAA